MVVQTGLSTRDMGAPGLYALDLSGISRDTLDRAPDGTLVITLGPTLPRGVRPSNWLRTEAVGRSNLTLRLYRPTASARTLVPPPLVMQP